MHIHIISRADARRAGLKHHFNGKPCKSGHLDIRFVSNNQCMGCNRDRAKKLREEKSDEMSIRDKKYYALKKDEIRNKQSEYYKKNREKLIQYASVYSEKNKDRVRSYKANNRAKRKNAAGRHTKDDIQRILKDQKHKCANCLCDVSGGYHVDHIMPLKLGGTNWPDNLQILCPTCNLRKNAKHPIDWAQENGRLL